MAKKKLKELKSKPGSDEWYEEAYQRVNDMEPSDYGYGDALCEAVFGPDPEPKQEPDSDNMFYEIFGPDPEEFLEKDLQFQEVYTIII